MTKLLECVLNFSEGTDLELIDQIVSAITTAKVINLHSDPDHNRSVITFIGDPAGVRQGAFDLTERAMQLLDVNNHRGEHPYIGVVDVIPFIPLKDCSMKETVGLAHDLGKELWHKLSLPVYFYGAAAKIKQRKDLPYVRKGGYAALQREIGLSERKPDVGRGLHATAGAVAVGARDFLIAFNINLDSTDPDLAGSIARNIRESHGGLPGVRAIGVELRSRNLTQVSINIVDHKKTSMKKVFDEVHKWAKEYKVEIVESEIVGLIPAGVVFEGMRDYLKLKKLSENIIIDTYL
ncbi:MAG: glutamate formimidoyltransferase [Candidatus Margulisbacteria bacterium]|nr:glutamate formimidoyltransferase [Candidatus Margulisiibacteriota bacterium]